VRLKNSKGTSGVGSVKCIQNVGQAKTVKTRVEPWKSAKNSRSYGQNKKPWCPLRYRSVYLEAGVTSSKREDFTYGTDATTVFTLSTGAMKTIYMPKNVLGISRTRW